MSKIKKKLDFHLYWAKIIFLMNRFFKFYKCKYYEGQKFSASAEEEIKAVVSRARHWKNYLQLQNRDWKNVVYPT
jgi:hypothetical protein